MSLRVAADVEVGDLLPELRVSVSRADLVRYAGASGDFNPIHWNERVARAVGLPDVIAHGMFTMAQGARLVADWAGDPAAVVEYGVRFTRPVVVPDDEAGGLIELSGKVSGREDDGTLKVTVTARSRGQAVLGRAIARVRLA
ncbi:acyl dehydratase [Actinoalloteichus hoggarensis]|uniref:Bifunctional enoyl-CoA hydratase/phosphate acetyltransferase n=1 Tax=Actinoalloteichus hoggarensis TaxID=1470176 RepID=A0A221VXL2_9PSEU|nr:MaoC family dehydratase [Actinoalloteichus hoggarensis]ASO18207.1 bifunctional enoyl-CoA hydratase/phosphate acetyltransferase [Actinoalloteichus hoggarensis]MBB5921565.1 acyl dehydratase [Actinoalloteichus hoggarensis]